MAVRKIDNAGEFHSEIERCLPWLIDALAYSKDGSSIEDLLKGLVERDYQLWTANNVACVTALTKFDGRQVCCAYMVGGQKGHALRETLASYPVIEEYAKQKGCDGFLAFGRNTWRRPLASVGFQTVQQDGDAFVYFKEF